MDELEPTALERFLRSRRSIRRFKDILISEQTLLGLIETASHAPSAHGMQPWRFVVVSGPRARQSLGTALTARMREDMRAENAPETEIRQRVERSLRRIAQAPAIVVLCRDSGAVRASNPAEEVMGTQSVAMAGLQLMLAARARGLDTVWICWPLYAQAETRRALGLPENWQPQGMVFIGYADEIPRPKQLTRPEEITRFARE